MNTNSLTTTALLEGLRNSEDRAAWAQFDLRYRPLVAAVVRRMGVHREDAADLAQEALLVFVRRYREGRYERERGRLRSWLAAITRNQVLDHFKRHSPLDDAAGETQLGLACAPDELEALWDEEQRTALATLALERLRLETRTAPRSVRAFELFVVEQRPVAEIAAELEMSLSAVYVAVHRCRERIEALCFELEEVFEDVFPAA